ncbi:MAG: hypothetical protein IJU31_06865 [Synergistaceae bacterium]|nr:hypothetical protein [Synergistaceae bacterium]
MNRATTEAKLNVNTLRRELHHRIDEIFDSLEAAHVQQSAVVRVETHTTEAWLTATEASKALGISKATFFKLVSEGTLPRGRYFGAKSPRWKLSELEGI